MHIFVADTVVVRLDDDGATAYAEVLDHAYLAACHRLNDAPFVQLAAGTIADDHVSVADEDGTTDRRDLAERQSLG